MNTRIWPISDSSEGLGCIDRLTIGALLALLSLCLVCCIIPGILLNRIPEPPPIFATTPYHSPAPKYGRHYRLKLLEGPPVNIQRGGDGSLYVTSSLKGKESKIRLRETFEFMKDKKE